LVNERLFPSELALLEAVPPRVQITVLGGRRLDDEAVERLSRLPGVLAVYRKMVVRAPLSTRFAGDFFGTPLRLGVEVAAVGVEPALLAGDIELKQFVDGGPGAPLPAVVSVRLLDLYNHTFAPPRNLPHLTPDLLTGFRFPLEVNRSLLAPSQAGRTLSETVELLGFSRRVPLAALALPLEVARRLNAAAGQDARAYSSLALRVRSPGELPRLAAQVREAGFGVDDSEQRLGDAVGRAVMLTTWAMVLLGIGVCVLSALNIAYARAAAVQARERELAVMRTVGARRGEIQALVLAHAAVLGLGGSALGVGLALGLARVTETAVARALPGGLGAEALFSWPAWVWVGAALLGLLAGLGGAYWPSRRAARVDPVRVLASEG
jgi:hypothetical protein